MGAGQMGRVDPIWGILEYQHRTMNWLANRTGYQAQYIRAIKAGIQPVTAEFRKRCAFAMDLPESVLFLPVALDATPQEAVS